MAVATDDDPITAAWKAAQGSTGSSATTENDDAVTKAWRAAQKPAKKPIPRPTDLAQAPRDVTATPASPQSAPAPSRTVADMLTSDLYRQTVPGTVDAMVPELLAAPVDMAMHPLRTVGQAVTAPVRAVGDAYRLGGAVRRSVSGDGQPVTFKPGQMLSQGTAAPAEEGVMDAGSRFVGSVMDMEALTKPALAFGADREVARAAEKTAFSDALDRAQQRAQPAIEGKRLWQQEVDQQDAIDQRVRAMPPQQPLLPASQYNMGGPRTPAPDGPLMLPPGPTEWLRPDNTPRGLPSGQYNMPAPAEVAPPQKLLTAGDPTAATMGDVARYREMRDAGLGAPGRELGSPKPNPGETPDEYVGRVHSRAALAEQAAVKADASTAPLRVSGLLRRDLSRVSDHDLEAEHTRLSELQSNESGQIDAIRETPAFVEAQEMTPGMKEDRQGALEAGELAGKTGPLGMQQGRVVQRQKALDRLSAELEQRKAARGETGTDAPVDPTGFDFGANKRPGFTAAGPLAMIVGTGGGAVAGSMVGDTPEERKRNAALGAAAGLAIGAGGARLADDGGMVESEASKAERAAQDARADAGYSSRTVPKVPASMSVADVMKRGQVIDMGEDGLGMSPSPVRRTGAIGDQPVPKPAAAVDPELERIRAKAKSGGELTDKERSYVRTQGMKTPPTFSPTTARPVTAAPPEPPASAAPGDLPTGNSRMAAKTPAQRSAMEAQAVSGARAQRGGSVPTPKAVGDAIEAVYSPATRGEQAGVTAATWRQRRGEMDHDLTVAQTAIESKAKEIQAAPVPERLAFMKAIETGAKQPNPVHQPAADAIRTALDTERDNIRALGTGKLDGYIENYFPHLWQDPEKAKGVLSQILGKRPLQGSLAWAKTRTIPTIEDGMKAGLVPVSYNPVELTMLKLRDMRKYRMAQSVTSDLEGRGLITQPLTAKDAIPDGYAALTHDPSFRNRYAPEPVAKIINNALSPGLRGNAAFDAYMAVGNTLNRAQLGFSAFHAGMTTVEQMVSSNALAVGKLFSGDVKGALKQALSTPLSPISGFRKGAALEKAYAMDPASLDPAMRAIVNQVATAGGRFKMAFDDDASKALKGAIDARQWDKAAVHLFPALMEKVNAPIMQHLVPKQKAGVFYDLAQREIERLGEGAHPDAVRGAVQKAWDSVDNRFGQVVYDNLFWNKAAKDMMHASVRSVGWNWGTFRELGGGTKDAAGFVKDLLTPGRKAELSARAQYAISLPITVGILGAITHYLYTGKGPETLFDYFHPQTGTLDADGNPNRVVLPTYMKDVFAYGRDATEGKPLRTLGNKLNPMLSMVAGMLQNRDFYGNEIRNPDDPFFTKVAQLGKYVAKEALPFSVQNLTESGKRGAAPSEKALAFVGVTPANRAAVRTPAQNKMAEFSDLTHRTQTPEEVDAGDARGRATADLKAGNAGPIRALEQKGQLTHTQVRNVEKSVGKSRTTTAFGRLTLPQMKTVMDGELTPEEQQTFTPIYARKKIRAARQSFAPEEP